MQSVLIIEDEESELTSYLNELRINRLDPVGVLTGEAGLQTLSERNDFQCVVIDIDLKKSEMDGWALLEQINLNYPNIATVVHTGAAVTANDASKGYSLGANRFLTKGDDLLDGVQQAIKEKTIQIGLRACEWAAGLAHKRVAVTMLLLERAMPHITTSTEDAGLDLDNCIRNLRLTGDMLQRMRMLVEIGKHHQQVSLSKLVENSVLKAKDFMEVYLGDSDRIEIFIAPFDDRTIECDNFWTVESIAILLECAIDSAVRHGSSKVCLQVSIKSVEEIVISIVYRGSPRQEIAVTKEALLNSRMAQESTFDFSLYFASRAAVLQGGSLNAIVNEQSGFALTLPIGAKSFQ